jgi:phenylacetate-CoA ligase
MAFAYEAFKGRSREEIAAERLGLLKRQVEYAYQNSPCYRALFDDGGIDPGRLKTLADFARIPVTTKEDVRRRNRDYFGAPAGDWVDLLTTSGTTGKPIYMPATRGDLRRVAVGASQTVALSGLCNKDVAHLTLPMSAWMWMAGYGFYLGFTTLGATVLRFGVGFSEKSVQVMKDLEATALIAAPSYAVKLGACARNMGVKTSLRRVFTVGENVLAMDFKKNSLGKKIEMLWGAELFSCYGATEGPFMAVECDRHQGHHVNPYEVYVEITDPATGESLPPGKPGIVTITPLKAEGFPLIRYATGDVAFLIDEPCPCGRMLDRLSPIYARNDQMMKIKGVLIYPDAVKDIITSVDGIDLYQMEAFTLDYSSMMRVFIPDDCAGSPASRLGELLRARLGVSLEVSPVPRDTLQAMVTPPDSRKPLHFVDRRDR